MAYTLSGLLAAPRGSISPRRRPAGDATTAMPTFCRPLPPSSLAAPPFPVQGRIGLTVAGAFVLSVLPTFITALAFAPNVAIVASSALLLVVVGMRQFAERRKGHRSWQT